MPFSVLQGARRFLMRMTGRTPFYHPPLLPLPLMPDLTLLGVEDFIIYTPPRSGKRPHPPTPASALVRRTKEAKLLAYLFAPLGSVDVGEASSTGTEELFCLGNSAFKSEHSFLRAKRSSERVEKRRVRISLTKVRLKPKIRLARKSGWPGGGGGLRRPQTTRRVDRV